jgi:DNA replication and repair protein RecF
VSIRTLTVRGFRNLEDCSLDLPPGLLVITGNNGAGKTNLLEAVAVLGNITSFRPAALASLVRHGAPGFSLQATVDHSGVAVELRHEGRLTHTTGRSFFRGVRRLSAGEYLRVQPVATLSSLDRQLVLGSPEDRRRFLDRLVFHLHPDALTVMQTCRQVLRQRGQLLIRPDNDPELDAFDHTLAAYGSQLVALRLKVLALLIPALATELEGLGWSLRVPGVRYHSPDGVADSDQATLAQRLIVALGRARRSDRRFGHTSVGPHRHDVLLTLGGVGVREALSAGQAKLLATALKLAAVRVLQERRGSVPTLVFDDVDAELDAGVLSRLLTRLRGVGQVLVSSAHQEMIMNHLGSATVWSVTAGRLVTQMQGDRST